ncbi:hypothetical protein DFH08DRAFT_865545 [Mycena albidolilacea]|uniref:Uncharacterized protein n=1 Tax=Mycena albidolilacea TaxID=1033008 RepID=A0AAD7A5T1_9AGAR|nr:hypothetical protein DFH08DRAFT_865545 [Mycena albidolilacea]
MTTTIPVCFEGLGEFTARAWQIPQHKGRFHALPADLTSLFIPAKNRSLSTNQAIELARQSGSTPQIIGPDRRKLLRAFFCARVEGISPKTDVQRGADCRPRCDVESEAYQALERLVADAKCHSDNLQDIKGLFVPVKHGVWIMDGGWAGKVLFGIARHCGVPWIRNELAQTKYSTLSNSILVGRTFERLHDHGVDHGDKSNKTGFRLSLKPNDWMGGPAATLWASQTQMRLITASEIFQSYPLKPGWTSCVGMQGNQSVLSLLNFMQKSDGRKLSQSELWGFAHSSMLDGTVSRALEWHYKYSELYPDLDNDLS